MRLIAVCILALAAVQCAAAAAADDVEERPEETSDFASLLMKARAGGAPVRRALLDLKSADEDVRIACIDALSADMTFLLRALGIARENNKTKILDSLVDDVVDIRRQLAGQAQEVISAAVAEHLMRIRFPSSASSSSSSDNSGSVSTGPGGFFWVAVQGIPGAAIAGGIDGAPLPLDRLCDFTFSWSYDRLAGADAVSPQVVNHVANHGAIGTKIGLEFSLRALERHRLGGFDGQYSDENSEHELVQMETMEDEPADTAETAAYEEQKLGLNLRFVASDGRFVHPLYTFYPRAFVLSAKNPSFDEAHEFATSFVTAARAAVAPGEPDATIQGVSAEISAALHDAAGMSLPEGVIDDNGRPVFAPSAGSTESFVEVHLGDRPELGREPTALPYTSTRVQPTVDGPRNVWIAKPAAAARGVGILLFDRIAELAQYIRATPAVAPSDFVVQKYVEEPHLVHGLKFDIRQFALVVSLDPIVVFVLDDCYLRFCTKPYSVTSPDGSDLVHDPMVSLSNHQVQKNSEAEWPAFTTKGQMSCRQFDECIRNGECAPGSPSDVWSTRVRPAIDELVRSTAIAWGLTNSSATAHRRYSFELLGFDILLDKTLTPWLLEVNTNPGLHPLTDIVNVHHAGLLRDMMSVLYDSRDLWERLIPGRVNGSIQPGSKPSYPSLEQQQAIWGAWRLLHVGQTPI